MAAETLSSALPASVPVGIVGAGAMGSGIAQVAATAGHRVLLFDTRDGAAGKAVSGIGDTMGKLVAKGRLSKADGEAIRLRVAAVDTLDELADCGLVIEAIVENLEAKRGLFAALERVVAEGTLLATNTSSISVTAIASRLQRPERLLGMHFFNPASLMPLVEIVAGAATAKGSADTLHATATSWGKAPVHARSTPGFIVNRVARPFYAESLRVLNEGGADCATIDAVLREAGGFRMGPFELMDLIGHDVNYAVTRSVFDAFYGDSRFTPSLLQLELVEAGFLGRKTGRGFYKYGENAVAAEPLSLDPAPFPNSVTVYGDSGFSDALAARLKSSGAAFSSAEPNPDGRVAAADGTTLYVCDGRIATARAAHSGLDNTVLVDLALDYATAKRIAITAADQGPTSTLSSAAGMLQAAGFAVSKIDDVPGMIVLRTVAMLINEAADTVNQNVCSAGDCDLAMRKGVNYPLGPLEWCDRVGAAQIVAVLDNMCEAYGEERYRASPLLRRKALAGQTYYPDREARP